MLNKYLCGKCCLIIFLLLNSSHAHSNVKVCDFPPDGVKSGGVVELNGDCTYHTNIYITESNTELDCNHATIDGRGILSNGIMVIGKGRPVRNIIIKNCHVIGFKHSGIGVTSGVSPEKLSVVHDINFNNSPSNIKIIGSHVEYNGGVGIYIDDYVTNATIEQTKINNNGGVGIYLDQSSQKNKIINNRIEKNGFLPDGEPVREGLAIDSSAHNLIIGNVFSGNSRGGIYLYKNCGEQYSKGRSVIRWQHSDYNIIENNEFYNQPVGVWIASRQSMNLSKWDCGDKPMKSNKAYYEDFANNNSVIKNSFCNNTKAVIIEGDYNKIISNEVDENIITGISEPVSMREELLGIKSKGNVIQKNISKKCLN